MDLRGACIHHDNGILGAATIGRAEERRIELLEAAGFNAIRSSHYPSSSSLLDACDRIGVLVIDEAFDMWAQGKSAFDYSLNFADWWSATSRPWSRRPQPPSVIVYSIGNEIPRRATRTVRRSVGELREGALAGRDPLRHERHQRHRLHSRGGARGHKPRVC